ncbi:HET-domain-containing protein, partial [Corynespora cassiicola Philippines]
PRYAALSHRWEKKEITFRTINSKALRNGSLASFEVDLRPSAAKIIGACTVARQQQFEYVWIDTCCIERSSSEELSRALNMMFKWYREAAVCYTFLKDVAFSQVTGEMFNSIHEGRSGQASEWFERGWTLQELLAPSKVDFYDKDWKFMGTRDSLADIVGRISGIEPGYLKDPESGRSGKRGFQEASVATKMSWMAGRTTKHVEDIAYSLLGLFNVNMIPQYGEGIKAFSRLQDAILLDSNCFDES